MSHPTNAKAKWKTMQKQIEHLARMIQHFSSVAMLHEDDLKELREVKNQLIEKGLVDEPGTELEPVDPIQQATTADYFPTKEDEKISTE